jgi:hypothetical protein
MGETLSDQDIIERTDVDELETGAENSEGKEGNEDFAPEKLDALLNDLDKPKTESDMPASIPVGRFKEVNDRYKATAEYAAKLETDLEAARRVPSLDDIKAKERQYIELMNDGEWDKAADLRLEINTTILKTAMVEAERASDSKVQVREAENLSKQIWSNNAWLQTNTEALEDFHSWRNIGLGRGMSIAEAMMFSLNKIRPIYSSEEPVDDKTGEQRREEALLRGMKDAKRQPPPPSGTGARARGEGKKASEYTEEEWEGLSKEERRRLKEGQ